MAEDGPGGAGGSGWGLPQPPLGWGEGCYPLGTARDAGMRAAAHVAGQGGYVGYAPDEHGE